MVSTWGESFERRGDRMVGGQVDRNIRFLWKDRLGIVVRHRLPLLPELKKGVHAVVQENPVRLGKLYELYGLPGASLPFPVPFAAFTRMPDGCSTDTASIPMPLQM